MKINAKLTPLICLVLCLAIGQVKAASFDCGKAGTKVEKLICANTRLSELDDHLATQYGKVLAQAQDKTALKVEQIAWLNARNACPDRECVKQRYYFRLDALATLMAGTEARFIDSARMFDMARESPVTLGLPYGSTVTIESGEPPKAGASPTPPKHSQSQPDPAPPAQPAPPVKRAPVETQAKPLPPAPDYPVRVFAREADKAPAIRNLLARRTLHFSSRLLGKEPPFCANLQSALRAGQGLEFVEPVFTTQNPDDPRLERYRRCAIKEADISSDFKTRYSPAVMLGPATRKYVTNIKLFRFDADNNPANGLEEFFYGEKVCGREYSLEQQHVKARSVGTGYTQMDLKHCQHLDGTPADWSCTRRDGLSAIIRFEGRYYILSMAIYEKNFGVSISNLLANRKHKWNATACDWSTLSLSDLQ